MMRFVVFFMVLFYSMASFAFNWNKCRRAMTTTGANIFTASTAAMGSTSSYLSSTGDCAAISIVDKQKQFLALNSDSLKLDSAMGEGEYLTAYANLLGCSPKGTNALKTGLQTNYPMIWGQDSTKSPEEAHQAISSLIRADSILSKECASGS